MNLGTAQRPARARAAARAAAGRPGAAEEVGDLPVDGASGVRGVALLGGGLVLGVLVTASLLGGAAAPAALGDPGPITRWGLLVGRTAYDLAAIGTLGVLLVAVVLLPRTPTGLGPEASRLVRLVAVWGAVWAVTAVATVLLTLSTVVGAPLSTVVSPDFLPLVLELEQTRALLSAAWLATLVAIGARIARSPASGVLLLLTAVGALVLPLLTGHAGHGQSPALTAATLVLHVAGAAAWVGGLAVMAVHLRGSHAALAAALPRYSSVALGCFVTVALSGAVTAWASLTEVGQLWGTAYGQLVLAKLGALAALGALGHRHRTRTVAAAVQRRPRAFLRLAVAEVVVMACAAALAVALSHTAPPPDADRHGAVPGATSAGVGHPTLR